MDARRPASPDQQRVVGRSAVNPVTGCWRWIGGGRGNGYGAVKIAGEVIDAHRYSWTAFHGDIPTGMQVLHKCDNRSCVNPEHLEIGTASKNRADAVARGAFDGKAAAVNRAAGIPPEKRAAILVDYDGGLSLRQLADRHDIAATTLRRLIKRSGRAASNKGDST